MLAIELSWPDEDEIVGLLDSITIRNFDQWPEVSKEAINTHLVKKILSTQRSEKFFGVKKNGKLLALLVYVDLDWDSTHFGHKSGRIERLIISQSLSRQLGEESLNKLLTEFQKFCLESKIRFVSADIDSQDSVVQLALQRMGFRFILSWLDGIAPLSVPDIPEDTDLEMGPIQAEEVSAMVRIASLHYFKSGRFYLDANFDVDKVNSMYGTLVESAFEAGDHMFVARVNSQVAGLVISRKVDHYPAFGNLRVAPLRFLVINPEFRGKNIASHLFQYTIKEMAAISDMITTGLEAHNIASLNLHSKLAFTFNYSHNVYHWWNSN